MLNHRINWISVKDWRLIFVMTLMQISTSMASGAHVHGQAYLNVVLDGQELAVNARLSAYDIVGHEHQPKTEAENQGIDAAVKTLTAAEDWLVVESGHCAKQSVEVVNPFAVEHTRSGHAHHHDFEVSIEYRCKKPHEISELQIKLTEIYSQIQDIEIQWLVHNKQGLKHLHGNERGVRFK